MSVLSAITMKFILALFAVLAIIGLGKAHQFPDFGKGPLHEDIQDLFDLIPASQIQEVVLDYMENDPEVQEAVNYLLTSTILQELLEGVEAIPEFINLLNYLQKEGIEIYEVINELNRYLGIKELEPPSRSASGILRTGGISGLFEDIKALFNYEAIIRIYVRKLKTSSAFTGLISQLQSKNFQQLVNKLYDIKAYETLLNGLKSSGVNTQIVSDVQYIVLGVITPNDPDLSHAERAMGDELQHFGILFRKKYLLQ
ncbi:protein G12 [Linepithema humile]|uniref:protein G12 n=1 Tax=Linepithema humile TaxID=83485 RepID=UPI00062319D6|nr:PREDICTED: protein G12 [Linepithema humile]